MRAGLFDVLRPVESAIHFLSPIFFVCVPHFSKSPKKPLQVTLGGISAAAIFVVVFCKFHHGLCQYLKVTNNLLIVWPVWQKGRGLFCHFFLR